MFQSYSQGASALALAIAFNSRNVPPGKPRRDSYRSFPPAK
jgi:hypothetical protein